tara:strand:+ start:1028 stop:2083 length:1056 start_codon:yes stop_codon:yes gene_type:complete
MAYTSIDDPSVYFQIATYTGNGTDNTAITNDGNSDLQPDWIWIKRTSSSEDHQLADSTRGVTKWLHSNLTNAESTTTARLKSFDTDGFTLGDAGSTNNSGDTFVAWQWKANGGTTSSNTDGSLTSTVQANTTAGFSIVTYSNPSTNNNTIGHGLGVQPEIIIFKNTVDTIDWYVASKYLSNYTTKYLELNSSDAEATSADGMNSTAPTSSVFSVGGISRTGDSGNEVVAYCFASKQGYSKIGSYTGNGANDGPFIYTGFKPAFLLFKRVPNDRNWVIIDNKRDPHNVASKRLFPDSTSANNALPNLVDLVSNGFKVRHLNVIINSSGEKYIYMAFAENPFVTSKGNPVTAR